MTMTEQPLIRYRLTLLALVLLLYPTLVPAQQKVEREYSIKVEQVPEKALQFTAKAFGSKRLKWYAEESQKGRSIEAKIKQDGTIYSIEFDEAGNLQDVEALIKFGSLPKQLRETIMKTLDLEFDRIKIHKVQLQWTGSDKALLALISGEKPADTYTIRYELIIRGTKGRKASDYEVLVDEQGKTISKLRIVHRDHRHLIF